MKMWLRNFRWIEKSLIFVMIVTVLPLLEAEEIPANLEQQVDALNLVFGKQTTNRAVHAKGVVLKGNFVPNPAASTLSKAPHFKQAVPIIVRFSNFAGIPTLPDTNPLANPRGLAIRFYLPDGSNTDLVTHSFNGFPSATFNDFRQLMVAIGSSGPGVLKPTPAEKYLATHPIAKNFLENQQPPPLSYGTVTYFGVNSFKFTNEKKQEIFGRYRIEPHAGNHFLTPEEVAKADPNYLISEISKRVVKGPVRFNFRLQIAGEGDKIEDPSIAWPEDRKVVTLGVMEITEAVYDNDAVQKTLLFLPAVLPEGIEPADPMIQDRSAVYPISYNRRHLGSGK